ncbi:MAG: hypothetical protein N2312_05070 [Dictyoglomaceae bacterium]|nr:hypothetical protein [Dictyoglomaceae bacterium]
MRYSEIRKNLPNILKIPNARKKIRDINHVLNNKIVVLDDDPTGCQTVHDIQLLLTFEEDLLEETLSKENIFYILTNSRAYSEKKAISLNKEIAQKLLKYGDLKYLKVISRSDSTLRGHFFGEVKTLMNFIGPYDGIIFVPYFGEGKRVTVFDTHYIIRNDELIEVNKTEFSQDPAFGYKNSHLPSWIEEKSKGLWKKEDVLSISIEDIRLGGPERIKKILLKVEGGKPIVINSLCDEDLEVFVLGLIEAEKEGKRFLYRTAASFVKIRGGIEEKDLILPEKGEIGLIIVGSYVKMTTMQLIKLLNHPNIEKFEVKIKDIINNSKKSLNSIIIKTDEVLRRGKSLVIYTEREYFKDKKFNDLKMGQKISNFLSNLVKNIRERPDFLIAKGGITSHVLAQKGLGVKKVKVLGQIFPGIPIWKLGKESKYPGLHYVVFPGNVGDENTLLEIFKKFIT